MKTVLLSTVFLLTILNISESKWTEKQYEHFEQSLIILADKYLPTGTIHKLRSPKIYNFQREILTENKIYDV